MDWQIVTSSWGFNYAFWASLFVAVALAYWTYTTLPKHRLAYNIRSSTVVDAADSAFTSSITVNYKGMEIPRATLSQVSIWNDGNQTIRRSDITPRKPLLLSVPGGQHILQISLTHMADEAMDAHLIPEDEGAIGVTFEYIDPRQGFIFDVLHTGTHKDIEFCGVLISAKSPVEQPLPSQNMSTRMFIAVMIVGLALPLSTGELVTNLSLEKWSAGAQMLAMLLLVIGTFAWLVIVVGYALKRGLTKVNFGKPLH